MFTLRLLRTAKQTQFDVHVYQHYHIHIFFIHVSSLMSVLKSSLFNADLPKL